MNKYKYKIALIFPFRARLNCFRNLMQSLIETTNNLDDIQVLVAVDDNDLIVNPRIRNVLIETYEDINLFFFERKQSIHFTKDYVNFLAFQSDARYIIPINDDCYFRNKDWDKDVYQIMHDAYTVDGDDIHLGLTRDGIHRTGEDKKFPHFSSFPVVSREYVDVMGYLFDERFYVWAVDHFIADVFKKLNRLLSLTHVFIDHLSVHTGRSKDLSNYKKFVDIEEKYHFHYNDKDIHESFKILHEYIKNK